MQHTSEAGPVSREGRCCITVAYGTNEKVIECLLHQWCNTAWGIERGRRCTTVACRSKWLASVCCISDATHLGSGPSIERGEMLHHCGLWKERVSECVMHQWCNTPWKRAQYREGRNGASLACRRKGLASVCCICDATHLGSRPTIEGRDDVSLWPA